MFHFGGHGLRTVTINGEPWFVAKDVCDALEIANPSDAMCALDPDEKSSFNLGLRGSPPRVVSESGLYALIMRSRKPEAKAFRKWVTSVVLPAIRKDGSYVMGEEKVATGEMGEDERNTLILNDGNRGNPNRAVCLDRAYPLYVRFLRKQPIGLQNSQ